MPNSIPGSFYLTFSNTDVIFEIKHSTGKVFSYIFNMIKNIYKGAGQMAYCGMSNANIAKELNISETTVKRAIRALKDKNLIHIEDSGSFKRRLFLNHEYVDQKIEEFKSADTTDDEKTDQPDYDFDYKGKYDDLLEKFCQMKTELAEKADAIFSLNQKLEDAQVQKSPYTDRLFEIVDCFSEKQKLEIQKFVLPYYEEFINEGHKIDSLYAHFEYLREHIKLYKIKSVKKYLITSLRNYKKHLKKQHDKYNQPMVADGSTLPDWWSDTAPEKASPELIEEFKQMQRNLSKLK